MKIPRYPASWYYLCQSKDVSPGRARPKRIDVAGLSLVVFRSLSGAPVALDARCCHFGSDLGGGRLVEGCIECPLHGWRFDDSGRCNHIPAGESIPRWATQRSFPVVERFGQLYVFREKRALFPFPFFEQTTEDELCSARPFHLTVDCPWQMVGVNGFDLQHYRMAHDRTVVGPSITTSPSVFARKLSMQMQVSGKSIADRLVRRVAGARLRFSVTSWAGNLLLATALFERTSTYGLISISPESSSRCSLHCTVFVGRRRVGVVNDVLDRMNAAIRKQFIRQFLRADRGKIDGTRVVPSHCIGADSEVVQYLKWLSEIPNTEMLGLGESAEVKSQLNAAQYFG